MRDDPRGGQGAAEAHCGDGARDVRRVRGGGREGRQQALGDGRDGAPADQLRHQLRQVSARVSGGAVAESLPRRIAVCALEGSKVGMEVRVRRFGTERSAVLEGALFWAGLFRQQSPGIVTGLENV